MTSSAKLQLILDGIEGIGHASLSAAQRDTQPVRALAQAAPGAIPRHLQLGLAFGRGQAGPIGEKRPHVRTIAQ